MKKSVQFAFAVALTTLAVISMFCSSGHMATIIYSVIIPSFILSIVSFIDEIIEKCDSEGEKLQQTTYQSAELSKELVDEKVKNNIACNNGIFDEKKVITPDVKQHMDNATRFLTEAVGYQNTRIFFLRCKAVCDKLMIGAYSILFLSLALSPYIAQWLSAIDLNCLTLWSLVLLYVTLEFKSTICSKVFLHLSHKYIKRACKHNK